MTFGLYLLLGHMNNTTVNVHVLDFVWTYVYYFLCIYI